MATPNPNLIYRTDQSGSLTYAQLDGNFAYLSQSIANITTPVSTSYAATASYVETAQTASYFNGTVENAATASYIDAANVDGTVENAATASYVDAANVDGTVTSASYALTASYALSGGSGGNIDTSSLATTGSNTFTDNQTIVGNITFPSSSFISTTDESGSLFLSALNEGTLFLNADGGEGDVQVGYNGWTHKMDVRGPIQVTNIQGTGSLYLKPDEGDIAERQFEIYNTAPSDIHFKGSATHSFFGDDTNYLKIDDSAATVTIDSTNGLFINSNTIISGDAEITGSLSVTGSTSLYNSGSTILSVNGPQGEIFSISDDTSADLLVVQSGSTDLLVVSASGETTISGSLTVTNGVTSSLYGTASWAENALTASYISASNIDGTVSSASYALSASYAPASNPFPFTGDAEFSGSILVSGSIIPNVDGSATSSFDLGSPTAAWKDIYVSNGTINFLDGAGNVQSTIGTGNNQLTGDTFIDGKLRQGLNVTASGLYSHAEGSSSIALGIASHAEGLGTIAAADYQHVAGKYNITSSNADDLFIIGNGSSNASRGNVFKVDVNGSTLRGKSTISGSLFINATGQVNQVIQGPNHSIGGFPGATGVHIQGITNQVGADASYSHVEGAGNVIEGYACHAEGEDNYIGFGVLGAHAEGFQNKIYGSTFHNKYAHYAHVEGTNTIASGSYSHAEGAGTITLGTASHAEGLETIAAADYQHVAGKYNVTSSDANDLFIIGNGVDNTNRSNALVVKSYGSLTLPTTQSATPSWTGVDGEIVPATVGGQYFLYMWMAGAWRSGSFA